MDYTNMLGRLNFAGRLWTLRFRRRLFGANCDHCFRFDHRLCTVRTFDRIELRGGR